MTITQFPAILTEHDRCDRCSAKAKLLTITNSGPLTFCGHHAAKFEENFKAAGYFTTTARRGE